MKRINLVDFKAEYKSIKKEIDASIKRVLESGWYILGTEVDSFEKELTKFIGTKYALGVASGTDALTLAIKALDLKSDDEVIVPANVYPTVFGVYFGNVKIKLCDVDDKTLNINLENIKKNYTKKTKAIVLVHLYGNPVDITPIKKFARVKNIFLIEDCAQAIGAEYDGKKVGTFGDISTFSFYPTKNLGAYGDGGAISTNNKKLFERVKLLRMYGEKSRYESVLVGHNSRLDEMQAAILRAKLKHLKSWNKKRQINAKYYLKKLKELPIKVVSETKNAKSVYHLFVIQYAKRQQLMDFLKLNGIDSGVHYPVPIHQTKSFSYLGDTGDFPISEKASREVLSIPVHQYLISLDLNFIVKNIKEFFAS